MDNIRDMFDLRDVYHDVVNYGESNQERFTHRWLSFIGFFTGKPPPPLASPSLKSGSRKDEFARLVDGGKGGDVEMSHVPGIHAAGMDGRHMYGDRSGGGSRFADAGRRRERRNSDGEGDGSSPKLGNGTSATSPRAGTPWLQVVSRGVSGCSRWAGARTRTKGWRWRPSAGRARDSQSTEASV